MCVIMISENKRLTNKMVRQATERNPHGIGMAWFEGGKVRYKKAITLKEAQSLCKSLPMPYVFHARYATRGGTKDVLCHPFPVTTGNDQRLSSKVKSVLFHNGTWSESKDTVSRMSGRYSKPLPSGPMSDTRMMAWAVAVGGQGILDSSHGNKFVVMQDGLHHGIKATRSIERFGKGWVKDNGYWVSNTRWKTAPIFQRVQSPDNGWYTVPTHLGGLTSIRAASMEEAIEKVARQEDTEHERAAMKVVDRRRVFQTPSFNPQPKKRKRKGKRKAVKAHGSNGNYVSKDVSNTLARNIATTAVNVASKKMKADTKRDVDARKKAMRSLERELAPVAERIVSGDRLSDREKELLKWYDTEWRKQQREMDSLFIDGQN